MVVVKGVGPGRLEHFQVWGRVNLIAVSPVFVLILAS